MLTKEVVPQDRPPTPFGKSIAICTTDEEMIQFKLKGYRAYVAEGWITPGDRQNVEFLIRYYENGGSLPDRGTKR